MDSKRLWGIIILVQLIAMVHADYEIRQEGPDYYIATAQVSVLLQNTPKLGTPICNDGAIDFGTAQAMLLESPLITEPAKQRAMGCVKKDLSPDLQYSVSVAKSRDVFELTARSTNREYAIKFLDEVMEEYIIYKKKILREALAVTDYALFQETERQKQKYEKAESELSEFQEAHKGIADIKLRATLVVEVRELEAKNQMLKANLEQAKKDFEALNKRLSEIEIKSDCAFVPFVKPESVPLEPSGPNRNRILIRSSLLGLIVSLSICLTLIAGNRFAAR
jgi:hypothetical protein